MFAACGTEIRTKTGYKIAVVYRMCDFDLNRMSTSTFALPLSKYACACPPSFSDTFLALHGPKPFWTHPLLAILPHCLRRIES